MALIRNENRMWKLCIVLLSGIEVFQGWSFLESTSQLVNILVRVGGKCGTHVASCRRSQGERFAESFLWCETTSRRGILTELPLCQIGHLLQYIWQIHKSLLYLELCRWSSETKRRIELRCICSKAQYFQINSTTECANLTAEAS